MPFISLNIRFEDFCQFLKIFFIPMKTFESIYETICHFLFYFLYKLESRLSNYMKLKKGKRKFTIFFFSVHDFC